MLSACTVLLCYFGAISVAAYGQTLSVIPLKRIITLTTEAGKYLSWFKSQECVGFSIPLIAYGIMIMARDKINLTHALG